eukprot:gene7873-biopygen7951
MMLQRSVPRPKKKKLPMRKASAFISLTKEKCRVYVSGMHDRPKKKNSTPHATRLSSYTEVHPSTLEHGVEANHRAHLVPGVRRVDSARGAPAARKDFARADTSTTRASAAHQ